MTKKGRIGSSFDDFLKEEGIYEEVDRLLDPDHESVTLGTLARAAQAVGRHLRLELV